MNYTRCMATISKNAIEKNLDMISGGLNEHTRIICVVKTNAYGHGAIHVSSLAEQNEKVWGFAVATCDEAMELREAGRCKEILILSHTFEGDLEKAVMNNVILTIFDYKSAVRLNDVAARLNRKARVHLKVDTGMSRIGFSTDEEALKEVGDVLKLEHLSVEGIFTHFAKADEEDRSATIAQLEKFKNFYLMVEHEYDFRFDMKHCANSAAAMYLREGFFDAVRIGISLYGLWPSEFMKTVWPALEPVMGLKARVAMVKEIGAGVSVSYGGTFVSQHPMKIATISFGYGDGYPRSLSNKGYILVKGQKAPILGRICMDQFMVDVSDIEGVSEGDEVTLLGRDGGNIITMEQLGELSGRFNYELACDINPRVHRAII